MISLFIFLHFSDTTQTFCSPSSELEAQKERVSSFEKEVASEAESQPLEEATPTLNNPETTSIEVDLAPFLLQLGLDNQDQRNSGLLIPPPGQFLTDDPLNDFDASGKLPTHYLLKISFKITGKKLILQILNFSLNCRR